MKQLFTFFFCLTIFTNFSSAQNVGIGTNTPNTNAILDIRGINKGLLIPRGNAATRTALNSNTAKGLIVYDTTTNTIWIHNGNGSALGWNSLSNGNNYWQLAGAMGTEIKNTNAGGLWSANASTVVLVPPASTIQPPVADSGTRLMWIPSLSAFRAGTVSGTQWNMDSIGVWSTAIGYDAKAIGALSTAFGAGTIARGYSSTATGANTNASGSTSTAMGSGSKASGGISTAMGNGTLASGFISTAIGLFSMAIGDYSLATGNNTFAYGKYSTATGDHTLANGQSTFSSGYGTSAYYDYTTAMGYKSIAAGKYGVAIGDSTFVSGTGAVAMGIGTVARSYASQSIGAFNDSVASSSATSWNTNDPLFYIGNGTAENTRHNAMTLYKDAALVVNDILDADDTNVPYNVPVSGYGTRLMWIPRRSAFRVGTVSGNQWDADNLGVWSFATGSNTIAGGIFSFASGVGSVAGGRVSTAIGDHTYASGFWSTATGTSTSATGVSSTAMGDTTTARSYASFAIGRYNDSITTSNQSFWVDTDPLFTIGNGTSTARHNAMTVYKNGAIVASRIGDVDDTNVPYSIAPVSGHGTRLLWFPDRSAFRVGTVSGNQWDTDNLGLWSFATGSNTVAGGLFSFASGVVSQAVGTSATAIGDHAYASGRSSLATGANTAATGWYATSMGQYTAARAYECLSIGQYNDSIISSNQTTWIKTDPTFIIGNGTADNARSNAVVVYKNADVDLNGYTQLGNVTESAPRIKMKKLKGTTPSVDNAFTFIACNIPDMSKILAIDVIVTTAAGPYQILPHSTQSGLLYTVNTDPAGGGSIAVGVSTVGVGGLSHDVAGRPIKVLITYEE